MVSTESSSFCKNSFGKTIWAPKTASAGERPVSSQLIYRYCTRVVEYTPNWVDGQ
jgi:hypothetical protein